MPLMIAERDAASKITSKVASKMDPSSANHRKAS
jgi:hypothetical protein